MFCLSKRLTDMCDSTHPITLAKKEPDYLDKRLRALHS